MRIKGMDFVFYCTKCKGIVTDCGPDKPLDGKFYCNCSAGFSTGKNEHKHNGIRVINKQ